jgi:hypothetical protein
MYNFEGNSKTMSGIPAANTILTSYENFVAECPWCGKECIFNRASDLHSFEPISGCDVSCQNANCGKPFRILGDIINDPDEMLILDCHELMDRKHYMSSILNLAQAYEVFFNLYFRVQLIYKPSCADLAQDLDEEDRISEALTKKIKDYTFDKMRNLFLQYMVDPNPPKNLAESEALITGSFFDRTQAPKDEEIEKLGDAKLVSLLIALKRTKIHTLRNNIVHKRAYRPTCEEVNSALKETRSILFPLKYHLVIYDNINCYKT